MCPRPMSAHLILLHSKKRSYALTCVAPWTRLLVEAGSASSNGYGLNQCVSLRKTVNNIGVITGIVIEQLQGGETARIHDYLVACWWWLERSPFSVRALPVTLIVRTSEAILAGLEGRCRVVSLHVYADRCPPALPVKLELFAQQLGALTELAVTPRDRLRRDLLVVEGGSLIGQCTQLRRLTLTRTDLTSLQLHGCVKLEKIDVAQCRELQILHLRDTYGVTAPRPCLRELNVAETLLSNLDALRWCPTLEILNMAKCRMLDDFTALPHLSQLRELFMSYTAFSDLSLVANLSRLEVLEICGCINIHDFTPLSHLRLLRVLSVQCTGITSMSPILNSECLEVIDASDCEDLRLPPTLASLSRLRELYLDDASITTVDFLTGCPHLEVVQLSGCTCLGDVGPLANATSLTFCDLSESTITSLDPIRQCQNLRLIAVRECTLLTDMSALNYMERLERIDASGATRVTTIPFFSACSALTHADFDDCLDLSDLTGLENAALLEEVRLSRTRVTSLKSLQNCRRLQFVSIEGCLLISELSGLSNAVHLQTFYACGVSVCNLDDLKNCTSLRHVDVSDCGCLSNIDGLMQSAATLTNLFLEGSALRTTPDWLLTCENLHFPRTPDTCRSTPDSPLSTGSITCSTV